MQTLLLILVTVLSFSVILLGVFCWNLSKLCYHLRDQLDLIIKDDSSFILWAKSRIMTHRENSSKQCGKGSNNCSNKCPIFD